MFVNCFKVDGGWSSWGEWSTCSQTCDDGNHERSRTCTNPERKNGGRDCRGSDTDYRSCNIGACTGSNILNI